MSARIVSINVGTARPLEQEDGTILTAIFKESVAGPVALGPLGLAGDEQVDRRSHGGEDKAVNVYPGEHYPFWNVQLARTLTPGAFGENLTTAGLDETTVAIGDIFRVGPALVQVTQPRQPCRTLAARHGVKTLVRQVEQAGYTGFYVRCLEPGAIQAGDEITLVRRATPLVTIAEANRILQAGAEDQEGLRRLLEVGELSQAWREDLMRRLL